MFQENTEVKEEGVEFDSIHNDDSGESQNLANVIVEIVQAEPGRTKPQEKRSGDERLGSSSGGKQGSKKLWRSEGRNLRRKKSGKRASKEDNRQSEKGPIVKTQSSLNTVEKKKSSGGEKVSNCDEDSMKKRIKQYLSQVKPHILLPCFTPLEYGRFFWIKPLCPTHVFIQGDLRYVRSVQVVVTLHDLGSNSRDFTEMFHYVSIPSGAPLIVVHLNMTGQEDHSSSLPSDYEYPSLEEQASNVDCILTRLGVQGAMFMGEGIGSALLLETAVRFPTLCKSLIAINFNPTSEPDVLLFSGLPHLLKQLSFCALRQFEREILYHKTGDFLEKFCEAKSAVGLGEMEQLKKLCFSEQVPICNVEKLWGFFQCSKVTPKLPSCPVHFITGKCRLFRDSLQTYRGDRSHVHCHLTDSAWNVIRNRPADVTSLVGSILAGKLTT